MGVVGGAIIVVGAAAEQTLQHVLSTLMRRNALEHILRQPGAQPLPLHPVRRSRGCATTCMPWGLD